MNTGSMSAKTACDVAVIGGGAAGMMAALQAAWAGGRVALLEKNETECRRAGTHCPGPACVLSLTDRPVPGMMEPTRLTGREEGAIR